MAIDHEGPLPTPAELGLGDSKQRAFEWQHQRNYAKLNDIGATLSGKPGARWVLETHAILGVIAEQVLVAIELEVEKEVARRAIAALPTSSIEHKSAVGAHYSRSLRFFAEGQANAVVVGLHGLANLMARTLEFDIDLTPTELRALGMTRAEFAPGSTARKSWLSWTAATLSKFLTMASTRASEIQTVAAELDQLSREQAIIDLLEFRNTQYHRWRGESAGVTGIAHGEPPAADILAAGQSVSFGREMLPPYTAGQTTVDELVNASRDALDAFTAHMEDLLNAWAAAIPHH
jgi:hypothetical protein